MSTHLSTHLDASVDASRRISDQLVYSTDGCFATAVYRKCPKRRSTCVDVCRSTRHALKPVELTREEIKKFIGRNSLLKAYTCFRLARVYLRGAYLENLS